MTAFYNDFDKPACRWMDELIARGHIAPGVTDSRSIADLKGTDLEGFTQAHFFAGIGGWSLALRLAGWPDDRPVWTGSCPCQPFSSAGKRKAQEDERHLWPEFARLIGERRPPVVFGEQVAAAIRDGWLDGVFADLEGFGYACGAAVLGAHSIGAPHIRQRLWWFAVERSAYAIGRGFQVGQEQHGQSQIDPADGDSRGAHADGYGGPDGLPHPSRGGQPEQRRAGEPRDMRHADERGESRGSSHSLRKGLAAIRQVEAGASPTGSHAHGGVSDAGHWHAGQQPGDCNEASGGQSTERAGQANADATGRGGTCGPWDDYILIPCADGKTRRLKPGISPLVNGVPARVVLLRGYGNAIVPQLAAVWIKECMNAIDERKVVPA